MVVLVVENVLMANALVILATPVLIVLRWMRIFAGMTCPAMAMDDASTGSVGAILVGLETVVMSRLSV